MAPEQLGLLPARLSLGNEYTTAVDMWALGFIVHQLLTGRAPFLETPLEALSSGYPTCESGQMGTDMRLMLRFCDGSTVLPLHLLRAIDAPESAIQFIRSLIVPDPRSRLSADEALLDRWITGRPPSPAPGQRRFENISQNSHFNSIVPSPPYIPSVSPQTSSAQPSKKPFGESVDEPQFDQVGRRHTSLARRVPSRSPSPSFVGGFRPYSVAPAVILNVPSPSSRSREKAEGVRSQQLRMDWVPDKRPDQAVSLPPLQRTATPVLESQPRQRTPKNESLLSMLVLPGQNANHETSSSQPRPPLQPAATPVPGSGPRKRTPDYECLSSTVQVRRGTTRFAGPPQAAAPATGADEHYTAHV